MKIPVLRKQEKIITTLKSLKKENAVNVTLSKQGSVIWIKPKRERALYFKFEWLDNNHFAGYVGYFVDSQWKEGPAVVALWTNLEAIQFASAYHILANLRAYRRDPRKK
jgi:hypothetical protein